MLRWRELTFVFLLSILVAAQGVNSSSFFDGGYKVMTYWGQVTYTLQRWSTIETNLINMYNIYNIEFCEWCRNSKESSELLR